MQPTYLSYDKGTLLVRSDAKVPYSTWDDRVRAFRAQSLYYREILEFLNKSELSTIKDSVEDLPPCPELKCRTVTMRGYQKRALGTWDKGWKKLIQNAQAERTNEEIQEKQALEVVVKA